MPSRSDYWRVPDKTEYMTGIAAHETDPLVAVSSGAGDANLFIYELQTDASDGRAVLTHHQTISLGEIHSLQWVSPSTPLGAQGNVLVSGHNQGLVHLTLLPDPYSSNVPAEILKRFNHNRHVERPMSTRIRHLGLSGGAWTCCPQSSIMSLFSEHLFLWDPSRSDVPLAMRRSRGTLCFDMCSSLKTLAKVLVAYYLGLIAFGFVMLAPWGNARKYFADHFYEQGFNPTWWGFFTAVSAFCNVGMTLTRESFNYFQTSAYAPVVCMFLIMVGNVGYPVFLRFIIWVLFRLSPPAGRTRESLGFLLDHPRRCYTLLFPSGATWWLLVILIALNAVDVILFEILDLNNASLESLPEGYKFMCGLFQAIALRTCGFTIFNIGLIHPAVRVSYIAMMYISAFPIAISMRRTNVYEEQSLGIYYSEEEERSGDTQHITSHIRRQLSFDLWYLVIGLFLLCISESSRIDKDIPFFDILFEVVSGYCCIGASAGYGNSAQSLCGQFTTFGKLVMIFLMVRGRHRGLPYRVDRAVMLNRRMLESRDRIQEQRTRHVRRMSTSYPITDTVSGSLHPFSSSVSAGSVDGSESGLRNRGTTTSSQDPVA